VARKWRGDDNQQTASWHNLLFCDAQRERGGVTAGERMRDMKGPAVAGRLPDGAWCSWCRRGAHSVDMTSLMAARAADWSAIFFPVA
jgi:hypothetical protein